MGLGVNGNMKGVKIKKALRKSKSFFLNGDERSRTAISALRRLRAPITPRPHKIFPYLWKEIFKLFGGGLSVVCCVDK